MGINMIQKPYLNGALRRLSIIEGQVRGIAKLVEEERYCVDILIQLTSVQEALRGVSKVIVRNHLETCVTDGIRHGDEERHYRELTDIMFTLNH